MEFFLILILAVSLSMDAFSLSLAYGTLGIKKKHIYALSIITGTFHFIMPLTGYIIGSNIISILKMDTNLITSGVLIIIGIQMIIETFKEEELKKMKIPQYFLFAIAVSLDSFTVGLTLNEFSQSITISAITFAITSAIFTFIGLELGNKIEKLIGKIATITGGIVLIIIGIIFAINM